MKLKIAKAVALILAMVYIFCFPVGVSAASQGTDGTELEVIQPQNLEIQLGESWAGMEFELKTDAGMYPGVITVGEDGVLHLKIGGSENYILSCLNTSIVIPNPDEINKAVGETELAAHPTEDVVSSEDATFTEESNEGTFAGIPVKHIAIFGGGMLVSLSTLIGIRYYQKGRSGQDDYDDVNDEK